MLQVSDLSITSLKLTSQGLAWLNFTILQYINKVTLSLNLEAPPHLLLMALMERILRVSGMVERELSRSGNSWDPVLVLPGPWGLG